MSRAEELQDRAHATQDRHPAASPERRVVVEAMGWDMRARRRRAKTDAQSTEQYLNALERIGLEAGDTNRLYGSHLPVDREDFARDCAEERRRLSVLILPFDGWWLDLSTYVRRVMAGVEQDVGRTLEWTAVNHPRPRPHAHVVLRGMSRTGHELPDEREVVQAVRDHAARIGPEGGQAQEPRGDLAPEEAPWGEAYRTGFTLADFRLAELSSHNRLPIASVTDGDLNERLESLEMMSLAKLDDDFDEKSWSGHWLLAKGWLELLLDWGDGEEDPWEASSDVTAIFAPAMDLLPWRATAARVRR